MLSFDLLLVVNLAGALIALRRLRPALLAIAANQVIVLQSLRNIRDYGQPESEIQNPAYVYTASHLSVAADLFAVTTALLMCAILIGRRTRTPTALLPAVPRWGIAAVALFLILSEFSTRTILSVSRMDPNATVSDVGRALTLGGLASLVYGIIVYELYRRVSRGLLKPAAAFAILSAIFVCTEFLKGQTGIATGYLICASVFFVGYGVKRQALPVPRMMVLGLILGSLALFASAIRNAREAIPQEGLGALLDMKWATEGDTERTAEGLESAGNGSSYAAQVLECITLYERGISRHWRSFSDPVIFTFVPSFMQTAFGWLRPPNAAEELKDYFISNGAIYTVGELYWNGGYLSLIFGYALILALAWQCDTRYRESALWLTLSCQFSPQLTQAVGYGFSQIARGLINGLLVIGLYQLLRWVAAKGPASATLAFRRTPVRTNPG